MTEQKRGAIDNKYDMVYEGGALVIVNRETNVPIPSDEPLFLLRGKDALAVRTLEGYLVECMHHAQPAHLAKIQRVLNEFRLFAGTKPDRMKVPD